MAEQSVAIRRLLPNGERGAGSATPRKAAAVIRDHAKVVGDAGLSLQRVKRIREDLAMDQHHRFPRALHLILYIRTVDIYTLHRFSSPRVGMVTHA